MAGHQIHCPKCGRKTIVTAEADTKAVAPPSQIGPKKGGNPDLPPSLPKNPNNLVAAIRPPIQPTRKNSSPKTPVEVVDTMPGRAVGTDLITCPACRRQVSSEAWKCPNCGHTITKPQRSMLGQVFKWAFIVFNALMAIWLIAGMISASKVVEGTRSEAARAGATVGTALGAGLICFLWVSGAVILGLFVLFTRPKPE
jgi:predicted RNA-binding Zn-ribbon protein involved in translation (DUF1610 family)